MHDPAQEVRRTVMDMGYVQHIAELDAEMHARWTSMSVRCAGVVARLENIAGQVLRVCEARCGLEGCCGRRVPQLLQRGLHDRHCRLVCTKPGHAAGRVNVDYH